MQETYTIRNETVRKNCLEAIKKLPDGGGWDVVIRRHKKSDAQRAYFHVLLAYLEDWSGEPADRWKMRIKYEVQPLVPIIINGQRHLYPSSTEENNKAEYAKLIECALRYFYENGLNPPAKAYYGQE